MSNLPPLSALRAFETAARHLSFTAAADELAMTQAAVSYQIKILEERLGIRLFDRRRRKVELTEAGARPPPDDPTVRARPSVAEMEKEKRGRSDIGAP